MIFTNHQLLNKDQIEVLGTQKLDLNDLIEDFAVTPENKIIFPAAKIVHPNTSENTHDNSANQINTTIVYDFETLRKLRVRCDTTERSRLTGRNEEKYVRGNEKVTHDFLYVGRKQLQSSETCREIEAQRQEFLLDNNYRQIVVSHTDCGYSFRGSEKEKMARDYADFICDGTNDTEVLQQAIDSYPGENLLILLMEDEYTLTPATGSGTEKDPYICLKIDRENLIIRSCDRKTNVTFKKGIERSNAFLFDIQCDNVDISNINYCLDELDIEYEEYKYPEPTDEILKIKSYIESFDPSEKIFTKKQALDLIKKSISETNTNGG